MNQQLLKEFVALNETERLCKELYIAKQNSSTTTRQIEELTNRLNRHYGTTIWNGQTPQMIGKQALAGQPVNLFRHLRYSVPALHQHDFFEIPYVLQGRCTQCYKGIEYELKQGDLCVLTPETYHTMEATDDETIVINLLFDAHVFDRSLSELLKEQNALSQFFFHAIYTSDVDYQILIETGGDSRLEGIILKMNDELKSRQIMSKQVLTILLNAFLIHIIRNNLSQIRLVGNVTKRDERFVDILTYIQDHYAAITLQELAREFHYSTCHLGKKIKQYTNKTFSEVVKDSQMYHAKEMLVRTTKPVETIAREVGFFDLSHFSRQFKAQYHMTPTKYRELKSDDSGM